MKAPTMLEPPSIHKNSIITLPQQAEILLRRQMRPLIKHKKEEIVLNELLQKYALETDEGRCKAWNSNDKVGSSFQREQMISEESTGNPAWIYWYLIYPRAYPTVTIKKGYVASPLAFYWKARLEGIRNEIARWQAAVGRISIHQLNGHRSIIQTGFRVREDLFITTRVPENMPVSIDFGEELEFNSNEIFPITKGIAKNSTLSALSIFRLAPKNQAGKELPPYLDLGSTFCTSLEQVIMFGYPNVQPLDQLRPTTKLMLGHEHMLEPKKLSPGHLKPGNPEKLTSVLLHDCSGGPGSEGAPILDPLSGKVVGMHTKNKSLDSPYGQAVTSEQILGALNTL